MTTIDLPFPGELVRVRRAPLSWRLRNLPNRYRGAHRRVLARIFRIPTFEGSLSLRLFRADGEIIDYGCVSKRVVTTAFCAYVVDALQADQALEAFHFHAFGTGSNAEAVGNTALHTELTTQYATDNTRPTGTAVEGASSVIFRTVGTLDPDSAVAATEHGVFDQASNAGGNLMDKTLFTVVNVGASGDTLEATYEFTMVAGG